MAIINFIPASSFRATIKYITRDAKLRDGQKPAAAITGINCSSDPQEAIRDWQMTKLAYKKTDGRSVIHVIQSFPAGEVTPEQAHKIGTEYIKKCPKFYGFEILVATHTDQQNGNTHNHFAVNSVNLETGKKWHLDPEELAELKEINNQICLAHGLSVPEKGKTIKKEIRDNPIANNRKAYEILGAADNNKLESYIQDIGEKVIDVIKVATSREDFIRRLQAKGVGVNWNDSRKYITFSDLKRQAQKAKKYKIRNKKLSQYYNINLEKEHLENGFKKQARQLGAEQTAANQLNRAADGSKQQPATGIAGNAAGSQQLKTGVSGSLQEDRNLEQLGLAAQRSAATQAERQRRLREQQAAAGKAREIETAKRAEEQRPAEQRAVAEKTARTTRGSRKKSRSDDWSL